MQATPTPNAPALVNAFSADHKLITQGYETAITLVVGIIAWWLCYAAIDRFFAKRLLLRHPRAKTYLSPIRSICTVIIFVVVALTLLHIWNVDIGPAIWSAGAITAVLAFGAQWVVRDLLAGFSIFAENQLEVGDRVEITTGINSQVSGIVESIGLRTTRLIDRHGRTVFIPNGNIYVATNLSRGVKRLDVMFDVPWRDSVETMKRELSAMAKDAARAAMIDEQSVTVTLDNFTQNTASFRISIRASEVQLGTDEGAMRERFAAALQSKGWLPSGDHAQSGADSTQEPAPADGSAPKS